MGVFYAGPPNHSLTQLFMHIWKNRALLFGSEMTCGCMTTRPFYKAAQQGATVYPVYDFDYSNILVFLGQ